jgi:hypothetical protein
MLDTPANTAICGRMLFFWRFLQSATRRRARAACVSGFFEWTYGRPYVFEENRSAPLAMAFARARRRPPVRDDRAARAANLLTVKKDRNSFRAVETRA